MTKGQIPTCNHAIPAYGVAIAGLPSQIAYRHWQKLHHCIPPLTTSHDSKCRFTFRPFSNIRKWCRTIGHNESE